jgi:hypothetical protein
MKIRRGMPMERGMLMRRALPILLILVAVAFLVYGAALNVQPVTYVEEMMPRALPAPVVPPFFNQPPGPGKRSGPGSALPPFLTQPPQPPRKPERVEKTAWEGEPKLVLEMTRGGIERLEDGRLKRTYMGAPPSGCPT